MSWSYIYYTIHQYKNIKYIHNDVYPRRETKTLSSKIRTKKDIRNGKAQKIRLIDEYLKKIYIHVKKLCVEKIVYIAIVQKKSFFDVTD